MDKNALYRFFSNQSTIEEENQILDWLDLSPENKKIFVEERNIFDAIILNNEEYVSIKGDNLFIEKKSKKTVLWAKELLKVAAVAVVIIGVCLYYMNQQKNILLSSMNTVSVPAGQRIDFTLPDGTKVSMNSMSELQYPVMFGDIRRVKLKGEAYFEVVHNGKSPFVVETKDYGVEVLGTTFNVNADADNFTTSLIEGKVKVFNLSNIEESFILSPNEEIALRRGKLVVQPINDFDIFRWKDGLFCFKNTSLDKLFPQIEKYYDVKIINLAENKSASKELSGKIRISEGIEHVLRVLLKDTNLIYEKNDNIIHIKSKKY
ncbi:MAG: FecR family protein [Prevotella sp.]|jgi:ferric-dicitrate binding protein FerR (iron transport regulator)|nr:FecR family protein [Prevotella sp.]